jgi:Kef-type K+ transport system membrane component KefB
MQPQVNHLWLVLALVGAITVVAIVIRRVFARPGFPALVGYLVLGMVIAAVNRHRPFLGADALNVFEFLGGVGVFCLLFRIGLESKLGEILAQLGRALWVWIGNVVLSGGGAYLVARHLLGFDLVPSLFLGIALTATSVGVSLAVWREAGAIGTPSGGLLIDVAELDDLSGIALMIVLFSLAPALVMGDGALLPVIAETVGWLVLKAGLFIALCLLFARYLERPITGFFARLAPMPDPMLLVVGMAMMVAALADGLGFSLPVGALFAGLIFSRDPEAVKVDASFSSIYGLFTPFFFVWIGLSLDVTSGEMSLGVVGAVLAVAVVGKVAGTTLPALPLIGASGALVLGVSMVPRAEIAMVIASEGRRLGDWAMPPELYAALVLTAAATCLLAPVAAGAMLRRWPPPQGPASDTSPAATRNRSKE